MKLAHLLVAVFWAIGTLYTSGCAHQCETLQMKRQTLADKRTRYTFKCGSKTIETTIKQAPQCLESCFSGGEK